MALHVLSRDVDFTYGPGKTFFDLAVCSLHVSVHATRPNRQVIQSRLATADHPYQSSTYIFQLIYAVPAFAEERRPSISLRKLQLRSQQNLLITKFNRPSSPMTRELHKSFSATDPYTVNLHLYSHFNKHSPEVGRLEDFLLKNLFELNRTLANQIGPKFDHASSSHSIC